MENWDDVWRRNQFVCAALARRHPEMRILFVGPARDYSHRLRTGKFGGGEGPVTWPVPDLPNITVTRPAKYLPNSLQIGQKMNEKLFRDHVRAEAGKLGMDRPMLWLNPHSAGHLAGRVAESMVVYDVTDDWASMNQPAWRAEQIRRQDEMLCRSADAVIVCSRKLYELKQPLAGGKLHLIPNGVDPDHYGAVLDDRSALPPETAGWARPVFGYTGTIHPDRVDVELVHSLASGLEKGTLVFIGPDHLTDAQRRRLVDTRRVVLHPPQAYARLPQFMRAFDVCIVPHVVSAFTESLNPIKLWEYLAAGKPIVATDVAGFRDFPQFVRIAAGAEEFLRAMNSALREDPGLSFARRMEARQHSWDARVDAIEQVLGLNVPIESALVGAR